MMFSQFKWVLISFLIFNNSSAAANDSIISSPETQVSLLELYTSEGCSSCPPADEWVSHLKQDDRLWHSLIPIAFHVNYWDYIGWKDRFASRQYSHRQRKHARDGNVPSVYTPGFVLNGKEWRPFFGLRNLARLSNKKVGVLQVKLNQQNFTASFKSTETIKDALILNVAVLGFGLSNRVNAGENRGQILHHDFVALGFKTIRLKNNKQSFDASATLPSIKRKSKQYAIVTWVSTDDDLTPIQATGGFIDI